MSSHLNYILISPYRSPYSLDLLLCWFFQFPPHSISLFLFPGFLGCKRKQSHVFVAWLHVRFMLSVLLGILFIIDSITFFRVAFSYIFYPIETPNSAALPLNKWPCLLLNEKIIIICCEFPQLPFTAQFLCDLYPFFPFSSYLRRSFLSVSPFFDSIPYHLLFVFIPSVIPSLASLISLSTLALSSWPTIIFKSPIA